MNILILKANGNGIAFFPDCLFARGYLNIQDALVFQLYPVLKPVSEKQFLYYFTIEMIVFSFRFLVLEK